MAIMKKINILITGAKGMLGQSVNEALAAVNDCQTTLVDVDELDITSESRVNAFLETRHFDFVINCAAFTAVDAAQSNEDKCMEVNALGPEILAKACKKYNSRLIHISTDYVFDGTNHRPYREDDTVCPTSVYGMSKARAEESIMREAPESIIIRTAGLFAAHRHNFVKTIIGAAQNRPKLRVVFDQVMTPTYAPDLAAAITVIAGMENPQPGIYHFTNEGAISWYDFAQAITRIAGVKGCDIEPCLSSEYPTPATRPHYSVLDKSKIKNTFGITIPYWEDSLARCIELMTQN